MMEHNFDHCTGSYYNPEDALDMTNFTCPIRMCCKRYMAAKTLHDDIDSLPKGMQIRFLSASECVATKFKDYINGTD